VANMWSLSLGDFFGPSEFMRSNSAKLFVIKRNSQSTFLLIFIFEIGGSTVFSRILVLLLICRKSLVNN
jgi:hypothetical protein